MISTGRILEPVPSSNSTLAIHISQRMKSEELLIDIILGVVPVLWKDIQPRFGIDSACLRQSGYDACKWIFLHCDLERYRLFHDRLMKE